MTGRVQACGWWIGPIWKLDGETCVCRLEAGHDGPHSCTCGAWFEGCGHPPALATEVHSQPDQSPPASRARAREETWRVAEAGRLAHLLELGRPLCGATDPGPWRAVAGAVRCAACVDLSEVLARHG